MKEALQTIWTLLNSPLGISLIAGAILWLLNKLYARKPLWQQFEGAILSGVRYAEKAIPDDTPNKSLAKLDTALRYVLTIFSQVEGRRATSKEEAELKDAIQVAHSVLEAEGSLEKAPAPDNGEVKVP